ncbi:o-succinylbenzoate synthase [Ulvibacterium marinum]|uniref:o-succinylbenzoate synthase n=1 Tax=Ulvibacterium marinum TaxID=2419782 RepID=UPI00249479F3|nr:o-succinylbenzoate synthase [Ulvibacterium marinum]
MKARYKKHILNFKRPSGTSRGILTQKETWFLILEENGKLGIGECGLLRGLSIDDVDGYEDKLQWTCDNISLGAQALYGELKAFPSIQFGIEQAFISLRSNDAFELFTSRFTEGESTIPINGLIWMGDAGFMYEQIQQKLEKGFSCIKMKIGAIDFNKEIELLESIRKRYSKDDIELRVDANGAFEPKQALEKLQALSHYDLHSIEQPIKQGQYSQMKRLCSESPLPIALDEELIGVFDIAEKKRLLQTIQPHYLILKPSLIGGVKGSEEWIALANEYDIDWWVTSALESNIGLNAIAQWTFTLNNPMPQGLGTGSLFTNNFDCPLAVKDGQLGYGNDKYWETNLIESLCM